MAQHTAGLAVVGIIACVLLVSAEASLLGEQWKELAPQNFEFASNEYFGEVPATRYSHCAVADPSTNTMYISHGYFYDHRNHRPTWLADTWAFAVEDGSWRQVHVESDAAPEHRYGHACILYQRKIYLFGGDGNPGNSPSRLFDGIWSFDLDAFSWELLAGESAGGHVPAARSLHAMAVLANGVIVMHGGLRKGDTWLYDTSSGRWREHTGAGGPGSRYGASAVATDNAVYMTGGGNGFPVVLFDEVWRFTELEGWSLLEVAPGPRPLARYYHSSALLFDPTRLVLMGGANCTGSCKCHGDTWVLNLLTLQWTQQSAIIATRYHHTIVALQDTIYTFGGESYSPTYMYHNSVSSLLITNSLPIPPLFFALSAIAVLLFCFLLYRHRAFFFKFKL
eukprot:m.7868 g.7868  ORF g.7868 m.7868 type:complete len:394 (+) comp5113_c0_seq1:52-1233(+)